MERIESKIQRRDGHWLWIGATDVASGYGFMVLNGRLTQAHRAVYQILVGPIPDGLTLDHLCRVRACVNPTHLEPVTSRENTLRGETIAAANAAKTHCPQGHAYDDENTIVYRGRRYCRPCRDQRARERRERHKRAA